MQDLFVGQPGDIQRALILQPQQIVGTDGKSRCNAHEHVNGRHDIVVFPVADTLLCDAELSAELNLVHPQRCPEFFDSFCKHRNHS